MDKDELLRIIEQAAKEGVESLDLSSRGLTELPPEIEKLTELRDLDLSNNNLTKLPPEIGKLIELVELEIRYNFLKTLPPEIGNLKNLIHLSLGYNELTSLPSEIQKLTNLKRLFLGGNKELLIPPDIIAVQNEPFKIITYYEEHKAAFPVIKNKEVTLVINDQELNHIIERAAKDKSKSLNLSNRKLSELPPKIGQLTELEKLDLSNNELSILPTEIGNLTRLTFLDLGGNQLITLPPNIGNMINLTWINLGYNHLTTIPNEICRLKNLKRLHLSNNNRLRKLPQEIGKLTNLDSLNVRYSPLSMLPKEIGELKQLRWLVLKDCELKVLPSEVGNLTNLAHLELRNNQFTSLPSEIRKLTNLTFLDLRGNPLPISPEILKLRDEPAKILNYYFQLQKEQKKPLNEAKVVIVGQGAVGKTSLLKRLLEDKFDPYETKTEGIDIKQWNIDVPSTGSGRTEIRLNVWDFGGQEIMHATHQFFLTKRSLYLLVLDSRLEEQENRVEYWLKIIQSFGGDSPLIVVCNKCDEHDLELNWKGLQEKYPTIKAFAKRVSCKTGEGISELRTLIEQEAGQLEHIHDELLLTWFAVKTRLEQMKEDYISYTEYQKMCEAENVSDELSQQTLLGFLHDLGIVLSFHGHYILEDTNVLNPEWVTRGIYQILNSNELFQRKGVLERKALNHILDSNEYPRSKHQFIIDMMRKFELCFDFAEPAGERFLVPDLLSKEEPYVGEWDDSLAFHYHYDILPGSVISRFIVRMHAYIFKRTYWRNGVVLVSEDGKNKALVKADIEDKKIFIYVSGRLETRSTFLAIIRADFRKIHASISKLNVKEVVPLPDHPEVEIDYQDLLKLRERGISTYYYPKADAEINVDQVLDSLETHSTLREVEREEQQAHSYFLSYSWNNSNEADHIELVLQRNQRTVLRDESYIEAGGRVSKSVEAMIQKADTFVALWSEQYDQSTWCPNELEYARNRQAKGRKPSRIVLIALDETEVPIRFIDSLRLSGQDRGQREQAIQRLLKEEAV